MKAQSFSIYLLKTSFDESNALADDHKLEAELNATNLPQGAKLFVLDSKPFKPWWKDYFGIAKDLLQVSKGALVFLPISKRHFALCFGHVSHYLKDESFEYDFGLRVTLNSVDPDKLKSTDTLQPGRSRRQRTQVPVGSDLTYFDFDRDSTILKSLTGKVKSKHGSLFAHATGASNIRLSSSLSSTELPGLCEKLLELYASKEFEEVFPDIQSITPIKDPTIVKTLNENLLDAVKSQSDDLNLAVPAIINYSTNVYASFSGAGSSLLYDDVFIGRYYEYLDANDIDFGTLTIDDIKRHKLQLTDDNGLAKERHSIFKCMVVDTTIGGETFHLSEGNWYKVESSYIAGLQTDLDPHCVPILLPSYNHVSEGSYNLSAVSNSILCLDTENIAPKGYTEVEPCDLYEVIDNHATFHHIKVSTLSNQLSHLFNQGTNAIELLKSEQKSETLLRDLITKKADPTALAAFLKPLDDGKHHVSFDIVTHKDPTKKSANLPLFSRISLRRCLRVLQMMNVKRSYGFIKDITPKKAGTKKAKSKKTAVKAQP